MYSCQCSSNYISDDLLLPARSGRGGSLLCVCLLVSIVVCHIRT
jgi:hypothetical protein